MITISISIAESIPQLVRHNGSDSDEQLSFPRVFTCQSRQLASVSASSSAQSYLTPIIHAICGLVLKS